MTTTTFTTAAAVQWRGADVKEIYLNRVRLWPLPVINVMRPEDPYTGPHDIIYGFVGDKINFNTNPRHDSSWLDGNMGFFEVKGITTSTPHPGPRSGLSLTPNVVLPDGTTGTAYVNGGTATVIDTTGMKAATYVILGTEFSDFSNRTVIATIHLWEPIN